MRALRLGAAALAFTLALAVLAAWLVPPRLDPDRYRQAIADLVTARIGRTVQIAGPVTLALLPHPVLIAAEITLPEAADGVAATVAELRLELASSALLVGRLDVSDLVLRHARLRLPWPQPPGAWPWRPNRRLDGLRVRLEDATLSIGDQAVTAIDGAVAVDRMTVAVDISATASGRRWQAGARLGLAGGDGASPVEIRLQTGATGVTVSGQMAADGALVGQAAAHGDDWSEVAPGPSAPWHAAGRLRAADGLLLAEDLDGDVGGMAIRGAVALRVRPAAHLDVAVSASRLDLDLWLPKILPAQVALRTSLDLSAEAANLAAGMLRRLHAAIDMGADGLRITDAEALLPGDAALSLSGNVAHGRFAGRAQVEAPTLRETLRWLQPAAPMLDALPADVLQTAKFDGAVAVADGTVALDGLAGQVDGVAMTGSLRLGFGAHQSFAIRSTMTGLVLDPWLADPPGDLPGLGAALAAWPGRWAGWNGALLLAATRPSLRGRILDRLDLDIAVQDGALGVRRLALADGGMTLSAQATLTQAGDLVDARLDASTRDIARLGPLVPMGLRRGAATLHLLASGRPDAMRVDAQTSFGDLRADAAGRVNLNASAGAGAITLRHQAAAPLLGLLGLPNTVSWLGEGPLSLTAALTLDPAKAALGDIALAAGSLRTQGNLALDRRAGLLTGRLDAETLPLPTLHARSTEQWPLSVWPGMSARLDLEAEQVLLGLAPTMTHASAKLSLDDGALRLSAVSGRVANGELKGEVVLENGAPPRLAVSATVNGATLSGPWLGGAIAIVGGRIEAAGALRAAGFSPAAMLATLDGTLQATVTDTTLAGIDLPALDAALALPSEAAEAGVTQALRRGITPLTQIDVALGVQHGLVDIRRAILSAAAGRLSVSGTLDLPIDAADLHFEVTAAMPGAPMIGLRLTGPMAAPRRIPELAAWLGGR